MIIKELFKCLNMLYCTEFVCIQHLKHNTIGVGLYF